MKRQKITDRNEFDAWDKLELAEKSNNRCAHCGVKLIHGVNTTVDHFIPLSKGGINQRVNITILCTDCNKKKGDKIIHPKEYLKYLNEKDLKALTNYFESYIQSFEFLERRNILACDEYLLKIYTGPNPRKIQNKKVREQLRKTIHTTFTLTRATANEKEEITQYFIRYLKKYDKLHNEDTAKRNIDFWMRFGCIYYIRNEKTRNIELIMPITIRHNSKNKPEIVSNIFAYYVNTTTGYITSILPDFIASKLLEEQNLNYISLFCFIQYYDKIKPYVIWDNLYFDTDGGIMTNAYKVRYQDAEKDETSIKKTEKFYNTFANIDREVKDYLSLPENDYINYMEDCITAITPEDIIDKKENQ